MGLHKPEQDGAGRPFRCGAGAACQVKMWSAVTRAITARVAAKSDGFAVRVATVWVAAITGFEFNQRKMPRVDCDTAQFERLRAFENR
jgi:hypothetical protein